MKREEYLTDAQAQFKLDHTEEIEAYERYQIKQKKLAAGEFVAEDEDDDGKEPPAAPELDVKTLGK